MDDVRVGFSLEKSTIDEFISKCESEGDDPNIILASLVQLYINQEK